ncbi:hypothetical protein EVAR_65696_1 [Eumeta japonica]|uniref:Uncharacterized protein n=1 Tax=Eumeta variegata TaxID=151549 RepID=A0A4C2A6R4_EUMVA|nr:hypothetical protein EVAR_65696_1 [Eumeta japonica]
MPNAPAQSRFRQLVLPRRVRRRGRAPAALGALSPACGRSTARPQVGRKQKQLTHAGTLMWRYCIISLEFGLGAGGAANERRGACAPPPDVREFDLGVFDIDRARPLSLTITNGCRDRVEIRVVSEIRIGIKAGDEIEIESGIESRTALKTIDKLKFDSRAKSESSKRNHERTIDLSTKIFHAGEIAEHYRCRIESGIKTEIEDIIERDARRKG